MPHMVGLGLEGKSVLVHQTFQQSSRGLLSPFVCQVYQGGRGLLEDVAVVLVAVAGHVECGCGFGVHHMDTR